MKKQDLVTGMIVEHRNGSKGIVLKEARIFGGNLVDLIINLDNGNFIRINYLNENLTLDNDHEWDIMKVCDREYAGDNIRAHILEDTDVWAWEREEELPLISLKDSFEERGYFLRTAGNTVYIESDIDIYASVIKDSQMVDFNWAGFNEANSDKRIQIMSLVGEVLLVLEQS